MKQTAVEWLYEISKEREIDKFDLEKAKEMEKWQRIKFEIPEFSDKEIQEHSLVLFHTNSHHRRTWISACKWYREQLKQIQ